MPKTPGYSTARFDFEEDLANAIGRRNGITLATSHEGHISLGPTDFNSVSGKIITEKDQTGIGDENGVQVDRGNAETLGK